MLKIRLARFGARKKPKYRIVVADEQSRRNGKFIEIVGNYDPLQEPFKVNLKKERYNYWISLGAKPTNSVWHLAKGYEKTD